MESPTRSVPRWTRTVATGPRPLSSLPSMTTPCGSWPTLARRSREASAVSRIAASRSSRPWRVVAETSTNIVSPPYSSATSPYSVSCWRIFAVVDVTHDGDHRRARGPVLLVALLVTEGEVEGLEELAVLVLGADHLDVPADLGTEQLQRLVVDRLRRGDHLAQVEQGGDQRGGLRADALGQVGQRRAAGQPDGLPVAARQGDAAHAGRRHLVELLTPLLLALAATDRAATTGSGRTGGRPGTARAGAGTRATGRGTGPGRAAERVVARTRSRARST